MLGEPVAPLGDGRRRHRVRPQHGRQDRRPLARARCCRPPAFNRPGFPGMGCWVSYGLGSAERQPADVRRAAGSSRLRLERHEELGRRVPARAAPGHGHLSRQPRRRSPICFPHKRGDFITPASEAAAHRAAGAAQPRARRDARGRRAARRAHPQLRTRREDAARRAGGARHLQGAGAHAEALRPRSRHADVRRRRSTPRRRPTTSAASASPPAGCSNAACASCRSGAATTTASRAATGIQHEDVERDHGPLARGHGPRRRGAHPGSEAARPARRHDHPLDHRVRPHAVRRRAARAATTTRTVFTNWLCGGGIKGGVIARRERRVGLQAARPRTTRPRSTTSTPRSCTCSASTTRSSPSATTASTAA